MSIEMVFNELSVALAADAYSAHEKMIVFVGTLVHARRENISGVLRVPVTFYEITLAPNYRLIDWTNDKQFDRDARLFLKRLATKSPFLADLPDDMDKLLLYSFTLNGQTAEGCGCAYLLDAVSISFQTAPQWNTNRLTVTVEHLNEDGAIETENAEIVHASCADHISERREWIERRLAESVASGEELWNRKEEMFPSLLFCEEVEKQMRELEYGTAMLQPVVKHLFALELYCKTWIEGSFEPEKVPARVSPESLVTLNRFGTERTFRCPDGSMRVFSWHLKINLNAWRIYFVFDDTKPSTLLIGYIGKHLPTVNNPT